MKRRGFWNFSHSHVNRYVRILVWSSIAFISTVVAFMILFGYTVMKLGQLGPYAESVIEKILPTIFIALGVQSVLFVFASYFMAKYLAYKLAGPLTAWKEIWINLFRGRHSNDFTFAKGMRCRVSLTRSISYSNVTPKINKRRVKGSKGQGVKGLKG